MASFDKSTIPGFGTTTEDPSVKAVSASFNFGGATVGAAFPDNDPRGFGIGFVYDFDAAWN